jgi:CheY-like chemotaxis protein
VLPHIFEPFFTTKEVGKGTGLGLSMVHSIMSDHSGRISYQPSAENGACFVLEFAVPPVASTIMPRAELARPGSGPTVSIEAAQILVLDDETSLAELLGEMLGMLGHFPTVCHTPAEALALLDKEKFDLILSDFRMPGMDGQQFFRMATQKQPDMAKRIVFLTGDVVNPETVEFLKSLGNPHLPKPFQLERVEALIRHVLGTAAAA